MRKIISALLSAALLAGCGSSAAASASSVPSAPAVPSASAAPASVWAVTPRWGFTDAMTTSDGDDKGSRDTTDFIDDYGQGWNTQENRQYDPNGIIFEENGLYGIMDYDGNVLLQPAYSYIWYRSDLASDLFGLVGYVSPGDDVSSADSIQADLISADYRSVTSVTISNVYSGEDDTRPDAAYNEETGAFEATGYDANGYPVEAGALACGDETIFGRLGTDLHIVSGTQNDASGNTQYYIMNARCEITDRLDGFYPVFLMISGGMIPVAQTMDSSTFDPDTYKLVITAPVAYYSTAEHRLVTDYAYSSASECTEHVIPVEKDGKWGFISDVGEELTDYVFDQALCAYQGRAFVKYGGKWGILNISADSGMRITADMLSGYPEEADPLAS